MAITRLDKVAGIHLESIEHTAVLLNGNFVNLGALKAGETELREVAVINDASIESAEVILHATPELDADPRKAGLKNFKVEAGEQGRGYHLAVGDIITLTEDLFEDTLTVGEYAVPTVDSMKLSASTDGSALLADGTTSVTPRFKTKVIQQTVLGFDNTNAFVLQVEAV